MVKVIKGKLEIDEVVNKIMTHLLTYLNQNRNAMKNKSDISGLISKMKGVYTSSRSTDELLLSIRDDVEDIVKKATKIKSGPSIAATRTGGNVIYSTESLYNALLFQLREHIRKANYVSNRKTTLKKF